MRNPWALLVWEDLPLQPGTENLSFSVQDPAPGTNASVRVKVLHALTGVSVLDQTYQETSGRVVVRDLCPGPYEVWATGTPGSAPIDAMVELVVVRGPPGEPMCGEQGDAGVQGDEVPMFPNMGRWDFRGAMVDDWKRSRGEATIGKGGDYIDARLEQQKATFETVSGDEWREHIEFEPPATARCRGWEWNDPCR